jgi:hypothetical protein
MRRQPMEDQWSIRNYVCTFLFMFFLVLTFLPNDHAVKAIGWGGALSALIAGFGKG